jgi:TldD protein
MSERIDTELVGALAPLAEELVTRQAGALPDLVYADLRIEAVERRLAAAEAGAARFAGEDTAFAFGVRVLAGRRSVAGGYFGQTLGAEDVPRLAAVLDRGLRAAHRRALANAEHRALAREKWGPLGESLTPTRLHGVTARRDRVPAVFDIDPRSVDLGEMARFVEDVSRRARALHPDLRYDRIAALTQLGRELFASSEGALIDQAAALTQGMCRAVAVGEGTSQEVWDVMGHQRGWEVLARGVEDPLLAFPPFPEWAEGLGREALDLARAPSLPAPDRPVPVVTDPHFNTLVSHEIIGHPVELDRALKMETAYAGRSWLFRSLEDTEIGCPVASPLVTAYSDPALPGYGHYVYDHEGVPGRRVVHIDRGIFRGFMNSRQTAAVFGGDPNGHWTATGAALVPLVRMSSTVFAPGGRAAQAIIGEVDRGYYLVGHRIPSIAESRENFRISARRVYEIRNGELGRLYRDGGLMADTRDYLMRVDAVGTDFRLYPIPNCGKGQPMQIKRLGNGGPTMRSVARVTGGMGR